MIKMIATDIDGTILNWNGSFSQDVIDTISKLQENNIKVVLVTGRMHSSTVPIAKQLKLNTPIISYQGGLIKSLNGTTLFQSQIDPESAKKIITWARKNDVHLNLYLDDKLYVEKDDEHIKRYVLGKFVDYEVRNFDDLEIKDINKLLAIDYENKDRVTQWVDDLSNMFPELYFVKSTPYFCEIGAKDAKKSTGVEFLRYIWQIKKEEVLTIGDQNNDIELLKAGGIAVAMGNATDELKQYADFVTDTVENDGFVKAIEKYIGVVNV